MHELQKIEQLMILEMREDGANYSNPWELANFAEEKSSVSAEDLIDIAEKVYYDVKED